MIGARYYDASVDSAGGVWVYSGQSGNLIWSAFGSAQNDCYGTAVAGLQDMDGDGRCDAGYVRIASGADGSTIPTSYGDDMDDVMGYAVTRLGDLDHDGFDEYAASAPRGGLNGLGIVRVFSGQFGSKLFDHTSGSDAIGSNNRFGSGILAYQADADGIVDLAIADLGWLDDVLGNFVGGVWVYRGCPASSETYGAGWPGKHGVPGLVALDDPGLGEPIDVQLDNSRGANTVALLLLGFAETSVPTNAGGTLLVTPALTFPIALPAAGIMLSDTLPDDPSLCFLEIHLQAIEADPFASKGLSFTAGLKLTCGFDD